MDEVTLSAADVWMVVASAMVLLMTPGLALFYGGMTRAKGVLNMMMMSFAAMGLVIPVWILWGYSMSGGESMLGGLVADPLSSPGLENLIGTGDLLGVAFSATFAIISVALISGAVADRMRFRAWLLFVPLWTTLVYAPLAFMVWGGGLLGADGAVGSRFGEAIDFAGGLVVHINAGVAALILIALIGPRQGFGRDPNHRPHNLPLVMLGAALLWFGWFGFNVGAADSAEQAGLILINTMGAPAVAMLGWLLVERIRDGRPTSLGAASGVVAGLVAITPACADVSPFWAMVLGFAAGVCSAIAVALKHRIGMDDSLDVVGVHLVSGVVGTVALGFVAIPAEGEAGGLFYGGGLALLGTQLIAVVVSVVFCAVITLLIALAIRATVGLRIDSQAEIQGIDVTEHAETGYNLYGDASGTFRPRTSVAASGSLEAALRGPGAPGSQGGDTITQEGKHRA